MEPFQRIEVKETYLAEDAKEFLALNRDVTCADTWIHEKILDSKDDDILLLTLSIGGPVRVNDVVVVDEEYFNNNFIIT